MQKVSYATNFPEMQNWILQIEGNMNLANLEKFRQTYMVFSVNSIENNDVTIHLTTKNEIRSFLEELCNVFIPEVKNRDHLIRKLKKTYLPELQPSSYEMWR
jgi:hypothetical protein